MLVRADEKSDGFSGTGIVCSQQQRRRRLQHGQRSFALVANTTGERNTATGDSALFSNNTGNRNTAIGNAALGLNTTGTDKTAISSSVCPREPIYFRDRSEVFYD